MNNIFYHVNKEPRFQVPSMPHPSFMKEGQTLWFGEKDNQFFLRIKALKGFEYLDDDGSPKVYSIEQFIDEFNSGEYKNRSNWPEIIDKVFDHYQWLIHELTLEVIRVNEFQDKPSRLKCVWLSPSYENAKKWAKECAGGYDYQILKIRAGGETFKFDASLLEIDNKPVTELVNNMRLYWKGMQSKPVEKEEILSVGSIKVLKIVYWHKDEKSE